jgi:acyl-coenzyme A thioesterase PaaI-like protein
MRRRQEGGNGEAGRIGALQHTGHQLIHGERTKIPSLDDRERDGHGLEQFDDRRGEAFRERRFQQLRNRLRPSVHVQVSSRSADKLVAAVQDPDKLNDETTYQRCFACGHRNESGLKLIFRRDGERILADYMPSERYQGFPGVLHGGILATMLDETMSRTGALRREWLMTGKLDIRYRRPAPIDQPLRVWGEIARERDGAIDAIGAVELTDGTVLAEARGMFVRMPDALATASADQYPEFINYWQS